MPLFCVKYVENANFLCWICKNLHRPKKIYTDISVGSVTNIRYVFRVFDEDNSGSLNFSEYLQVWLSQECTRNRFDIGVKSTLKRSEWQLTTLIDKRQQRRFNFHVGGGRTKAQYVTSRISLQTLADWPWIWSSTYVNVKGNLVASAWGELTGYTLNTPCFMVPWPPKEGHESGLGLKAHIRKRSRKKKRIL